MASDGSDLTFFLRHRGRVSGPFAIADLSRQVRRGTLGRAHEVSRDGTGWVAAGTIAELFGPAVPEAHPPAAALAAGDPSAAKSAAGPMLSYRADGESFGPMPAALLETLILGDKVPADATVWADGDAARVPAAEHPLLRHLFAPPPVATPTAAAEPRTRPKSSSGCAILLIIFALACIGGGVYLAIDLSSTDDDSPTTLESPTDATTP